MVCFKIKFEWTFCSVVSLNWLLGLLREEESCGKGREGSARAKNYRIGNTLRSYWLITSSQFDCKVDLILLTDRVENYRLLFVQGDKRTGYCGFSLGLLKSGPRQLVSQLSISIIYLSELIRRLESKWTKKTQTLYRDLIKIDWLSNKRVKHEFG